MDEQVEFVVGCITAKITLMALTFLTVNIFHMAVVSAFTTEILAASITFVQLLECPLILRNVTLGSFKVFLKNLDRLITEWTRCRLERYVMNSFDMSVHRSSIQRCPLAMGTL